MKKVLVGTCVLAMTAFGITNASADPVSNARANAFGIELSLLGSELIDREPEVTSVFPPGGSEEEDVVTIDAEELLLEGVGIQQAETSGESTIRPMLVPDGEGDSGGEGGDDLLGDLLGGSDDEGGSGGEGGGDDLLGGILGGGDDNGGGGLLDDILGGGDDEEDSEEGFDGFGGPDDDDIEIPEVNARALSSISITGVAIDEEEGGGEGGGEDGGSDFLGLDLDNLLGGSDDEEDSSGVAGISSAQEDEAGTVQAQQSDGLGDILGEGVTGGELQDIVFEALLRLGAVESEAVAVCRGNEVFFDVASRLVDDQGSDIEIGDVLDDAISEVLDITDELAPDLIRTEEGEVGRTADGTGVFINALHVVVGEDLGGDLLGGGDGGGEGGGGEDLLGGVLGGGDDEGGSGGDSGEDEPLLDLVLGHSEVSGNVCAQQAAPPQQEQVPSGDGPTLPVTGGGLGALPAVLALGLAGGGLAAGRLALRSRRDHSL